MTTIIPITMPHQVDLVLEGFDRPRPIAPVAAAAPAPAAAAAPAAAPPPALVGENAELRTRVERLTAENERLKGENERMAKLAEENIGRLNNELQENKRLTGELTLQNEQLRQGKEEVAQLKRRNEELQKNAEGVRSASEEQTRKNQDLEAGLARLTQNLRDALEQNKDLQKQNVDLTGQIAERQKQLGELNTENERLRKQNEEVAKQGDLAAAKEKLLKGLQASAEYYTKRSSDLRHVVETAKHALIRVQQRMQPVDKDLNKVLDILTGANVHPVAGVDELRSDVLDDLSRANNELKKQASADQEKLKKLTEEKNVIEKRRKELLLVVLDAAARLRFARMNNYKETGEMEKVIQILEKQGMSGIEQPAKAVCVYKEFARIITELARIRAVPSSRLSAIAEVEHERGRASSTESQSRTRTSSLGQLPKGRGHVKLSEKLKVGELVVVTPTFTNLNIEMSRDNKHTISHLSAVGLATSGENKLECAIARHTDSERQELYYIVFIREPGSDNMSTYITIPTAPDTRPFFRRTEMSYDLPAWR